MLRQVAWAPLGPARPRVSSGFRSVSQGHLPAGAPPVLGSMGTQVLPLNCQRGPSSRHMLSGLCTPSQRLLGAISSHFLR